MTQEQIVESNKMIADFMGMGAQFHLVEHPDTGEYVEAQFHSSWDWLMPVVEKIETLKSELGGKYGVYIVSNGCCIQDTKLDLDKGVGYFSQHYKTCREKSKLASTYEAVVQFIKWYNENNLKNVKNGNM